MICNIGIRLIVAILLSAGFWYLWYGYGDMATACFVGSLAFRL